MKVKILEWKGFKSNYLIYEDGKIYSLISNKFLKGRDSKSGKGFRRVFNLTIAEKIYCVSAHLLVWTNFKGEVSKSGSICFRNGYSPALSNLYEDIRHPAHGEHLRRLTEKDVIEIKKYLSLGVLGKEIAKEFHVTAGTVSAINVGRTWSWVKSGLEDIK